MCARDPARWLSLRFSVPSPNQSGKASADHKHCTGFGYCLQTPYQIDPQSTIRGSRFRTLCIPIVGPEHQRRFRKTVGPSAVIHKINRSSPNRVGNFCRFSLPSFVRRGRGGRGMRQSPLSTSARFRITSAACCGIRSGLSVGLDSLVVAGSLPHLSSPYKTEGGHPRNHKIRKTKRNVNTKYPERLSTGGIRTRLLEPLAISPMEYPRNY